jgi:hypothetical protein
MRQARKPSRLRPRARSLPECLRQFLTPATWKQAQSCRRPDRSQRWQTQALVLVAVGMTWCCGDSLAEKFEAARAVCVVCRGKRRRPGRTVHGFQKALAHLPMPVLRAVAAGVRQQVVRRLAGLWRVQGFVPLGCDGSRIECPRAAELERHLGQAGKVHAAPTLWVTALVHLRLGVPWAWRWGKGTASERNHLMHLLTQLPRQALIVADAGYVGFALAQALAGAEISFLIRMSSIATLYMTETVPLAQFREGRCYYWPGPAQRSQHKPVRVRLLRVRSRQKGADVWLLTNVLSGRRLSVAQAGQFYRWRWENEGLFRTYKQTLKKLKLQSRTVRLVHREAEASLLATQLLLAQGAAGLRPATRGQAVACSPRQVLLAIRAEIRAVLPKGRPGRLGQRLTAARREQRRRTSSKVKRVWPRRKPTQPPGPPRILKLTDKQKRLIHKLESDET